MDGSVCAVMTALTGTRSGAPRPARRPRSSIQGHVPSATARTSPPLTIACERAARLDEGDGLLPQHGPAELRVPASLGVAHRASGGLVRPKCYLQEHPGLESFPGA